MPVTLTTASHASRKWTNAKADSSEDLLSSACKQDHKQCKSIIQSSVSRKDIREKHITPSANGFVWACFHAYSGHHHLTIRPEDVWFSILSQLNFYINANAEQLRSYFVDHEGQKALEVKEAGSIDYADFGKMAYRMTNLIQENVKDPELREWMMPSFTTTTDSDRVVAAVLMMGSLQKYFSYTFGLVCGIPSVTLLGEREDWENILQRLDKLPKLGSEPAQFGELLKPILRNFIASFDPQPSPSVFEFWTKIAHRTGGSGPYYLSGWITAFCFWNEDGKSLYRDGPEPTVSLAPFMGSKAGCNLDGVLYHRVDTKDIPSGFASVPVTVDDNGEEYKTKMVAGSFGIQATSSGQMVDEGYEHLHEPRYVDDDDDIIPEEEHQPAPAPAPPTGEPCLDSIQPLSGWFMYELNEEGAGNDEEKLDEGGLESSDSDAD